jgi:ABC-type polysaccharide/polyol phosphate export permease
MALTAKTWFTRLGKFALSVIAAIESLWNTAIRTVRPTMAAAGTNAGEVQPSSRRSPVFGSGGPYNMVIGWLDSIVAFVALERSLIMRNIMIVGRGDPMHAYGIMIRIFFVINAHIWFFWSINRPIPSSISYVIFNTAGFSVWMFFSIAARCATPTARGAHLTVALNLKWIHLFLADLVWHMTGVFLAMTVTLVFYTVFPFPRLGPPIVMPNMPMLLACCAIAAVQGAGIGMMFVLAGRRWPIMEVVWEIFYWVMFVSAGVYECYSTFPWYVQRYYRYFPMIALIEYSRKALAPGYSTADLNLYYPAELALLIIAVALLVRPHLLKPH